MARCIKTNHDTSSGKKRETEVPTGRRAGPVICGEECFFGRSESVCLTSSDGQPNQIQQEVDEYQGRRGVKDPTEIASYVNRQRLVHDSWRRLLTWDEIGYGSECQQNLGADPLHCPELDAAGVGREVEVEDDNFLPSHESESEACYSTEMKHTDSI